MAIMHKTLFFARIPLLTSLKSAALICLLTTSACSIICGAACDWIEPGECLGEGEMFGPCNPDGTCTNLKCNDTDKGWICLPGSDVADDWSAAECASWRGNMSCSLEKNICYLACDGPDECKGGTVCNEDIGMCVYPKPSYCDCPDGQSCDDSGACVPNEMCLHPEGPFGPCDLTKVQSCAAGLFCRTTSIGSICLPPCTGPDECGSSCAAAFGTACEPDGTCTQPCIDDTTCLKGQACYVAFGMGYCVWPH